MIEFNACFEKFIIEFPKKNTRVFSQTHRNYGDPRGRMRFHLLCLIVTPNFFSSIATIVVRILNKADETCLINRVLHLFSSRYL